MGPTPVWPVFLYKGEVGYRDTKGRPHVKMKADIGVKHLQDNEHRRLSAEHQEPKERPGQILLCGPQQDQPWWHLDSDFWPPEMGGNNTFLACKPPNMWRFVMAALVSYELRHTWNRIGQKTCVSRPPTWSSTTVSEYILCEVLCFMHSNYQKLKRKMRGTSLVIQWLRIYLPLQETQVWSQSMGSQRVGHNWATSMSMSMWRIKIPQAKGQLSPRATITEPELQSHSFLVQVKKSWRLCGYIMNGNVKQRSNCGKQRAVRGPTWWNQDPTQPNT